MTDAELLSRLLAGACEVDERLLEDLLAEGVPASVALRRASRGWWHGGVALLLGGALALSGARDVAAHEVAAPSAAPAAVTSSGAGALSSVAAHIAGGAAAEATVGASGAEAQAGMLDAALAQTPIVADTVLFIPDMSADASISLQSGQLYTVVPGDTLWGIAQRFYGNGALWNEIFKTNANLIADPHWIFPGQSFTIPTLQLAIAGPIPAPTGTYTVQAGDCLWDIALARYGDGMRYRDIYNANAGIISDPHWIYPGQVLRLP